MKHGLDFKNSRKKEDLSHKSPKELINKIINVENKIEQLLASIKKD